MVEKQTSEDKKNVTKKAVSKNEISGEGGSVLSSPPIYSDTACLAPQPERIK